MALGCDGRYASSDRGMLQHGMRISVEKIKAATCSSWGVEANSETSQSSSKYLAWSSPHAGAFTDDDHDQDDGSDLGCGFVMSEFRV